MRMIMAEIGSGALRMEAAVVRTEEGLSVYLGGGERYHVGCVVLCQPRLSLKGGGSLSTTVSTMNLLSHKDDGVAVPLAQRLCLATGEPVAVTAGVHIENANAEQIKEFLTNVELLADNIIETMRGDAGNRHEEDR